MPQPPVGPDDDFSQMMKDHKDKDKGKRQEERQSFWEVWSHSPGFQAALTTVVGLIMVFGGGMGYLQWYKAHVLHRVERAFQGGYVRRCLTPLTTGPGARTRLGPLAQGRAH